MKSSAIEMQPKPVMTIMDATKPNAPFRDQHPAMAFSIMKYFPGISRKEWMDINPGVDPKSFPGLIWTAANGCFWPDKAEDMFCAEIESRTHRYQEALNGMERSMGASALGRQ